MNHEHEKLKMNVRVFTDVLKSEQFSSQIQPIIDALISTIAFQEMVRLSGEPVPAERLNDDGEVDEEYDPSESNRPEWEVNPER